MSSAPKDLIGPRISEIQSIILIKKEKMETLRAEISLLEEEIQRLTHHIDSINPTGVESKKMPLPTNHGSNTVNGVSRRARRDSPEIRPGSIKEAVVEVLARNPNGLIALDILRHINAEREIPLERTSLSPQLSRLQRVGVISNKNGVWSLVAA
jgi:hypothetical protein